MTQKDDVKIVEFFFSNEWDVINGNKQKLEINLFLQRLFSDLKTLKIKTFLKPYEIKIAESSGAKLIQNLKCLKFESQKMSI